MFNYMMRRFFYTIPILLGINLITFSLFFIVNSPDDVARMHLGKKYVTSYEINLWKDKHGYNAPLFFNASKNGLASLTQTLFFEKSLKLFMFDFGSSDAGRDIQQDILERMIPSLWIALPSFILSLILNISCALMFVFFRKSYVEQWGNFLCISALSISSLFYIIFGQYLFSKMFQLFPVSGYADGNSFYKFLILPVLIQVLYGWGAGTRWYKAIFLEEIHKEYVTTAKSKGLSEIKILFSHVLKNGLIPILTGVVVIIPLLFMGSLIIESFFGIPGLGSYTIDAINSQDFAIVRSIVFLGSLLYVVGLMLTDIAYVFVDPRMKLS